MNIKYRKEVKKIDTEIIKNLTDTFKNNFTASAPTIAFALCVLVIGFMLSKLVKKSATKFLTRLSIDQPILNYSAYSIYITCLILTVMITLSVIGIPETTIFSVIGVVGVSLGIAFKEVLSNLGSGYVLLFLKPFKIDDYVEFAGIEGTVTNIHLFNTTLKTFDNKTIIIPNSKLTNQSITNYTNQDRRRVDIKFNLPYGTDITAVRTIIEEIFKSEESIIEECNSIIGIRTFKENGVELLVTAWVETSMYWDTFYSLTSKIEKTFRKNGIDMSIPQRVLYEEYNKKRNK